MGEMCSRFSHADHWSFSPQVTEVFLEPREGRVSLERRVQSASPGLAFQDLPAPKVNPQDEAALGGRCSGHCPRGPQWWRPSPAG